MSLQAQIQKDLTQAMKDNNTAVKSTLRTLMGEFNRKGKELTDAEVVNEIKKYIENCKIVGNFSEATMLESYLPKQLSEDELNTTIKTLITENNYTVKDMGKIMASLKQQFAGQYDGKLASELVKRNLS